MFSSGVQSEFRLDSRQEHAGMTDLEKTLDSPRDKCCCSGSVEHFATERLITVLVPRLAPAAGIRYRTESNSFFLFPLIKGKFGRGGEARFRDHDAAQGISIKLSILLCYLG